MYYSTVRIRPSIDADTWEVFFSDMPYDREPGGEHISGLGFYHYNRRKGKQKAFDTLKADMIKRHKDEIQKLEKSLKKLEMLGSGL